MKRLAALAALILVGAASPERLLLREQSWTAPTEGRDLAYAMTHAPQECLAVRDSADVDAGRALFRSPTLLGGPAARAGLSCNACHANGRVNTHFLLPELTDRAGAADVTSEWSSRVRGDATLNPVAIPDLVGVTRRAAFGQMREPSLRRFVHSVMVEEFQGAEPSDSAMMVMMTYLAALNAKACVAGDETVTLRAAADDVRRALAGTLAVRDRATRSLLLAAGQDAVGRIVERLPADTFADDRRRFEALARELGAMRTEQLITIEGWQPRFDAALARVALREDETYFNEATLRAALAH